MFLISCLPPLVFSLAFVIVLFLAVASEPKTAWTEKNVCCVTWLLMVVVVLVVVGGGWRFKLYKDGNRQKRTQFGRQFLQIKYAGFPKTVAAVFPFQRAMLSNALMVLVELAM